MIHSEDGATPTLPHALRYLPSHLSLNRAIPIASRNPYDPCDIVGSLYLLQLPIHSTFVLVIFLTLSLISWNQNRSSSITLSTTQHVTYVCLFVWAVEITAKCIILTVKFALVNFKVHILRKQVHPCLTFAQ